MKLQQIHQPTPTTLEWFESDLDQQGGYIDPDTILNNGDNQHTIIYTDKLHIMPNGTHQQLLQQTPELAAQAAQAAQPHAHKLLRDKALLARTGDLPTPTISVWDSSKTTADRLLTPMLQALLHQGYITPQHQLHHPKLEPTTVEDYLKGSTHDRHDPELEHRAELARQLHLLPSPQKAVAMKQLGLTGKQKTNQWTRSMRHAGIPAGSSHHFSTSENLATRLTHIWG